ncbi:uncharacterized protein EI90DRAFT_2952720 [Cantharellus anzutake]|uniref:uncharacterized protein n=1 Tax=Cantharellus anzutake TaxID=1750568 RepID=UPI00190807E4|nr:uncharacterized protein EI90DRAFT_2952720 [Cantharellus anzutake]KAF8311808.1 hypothetical protein EI90DRAFT_2952720 [Cantharellus anzutake]
MQEFLLFTPVYTLVGIYRLLTDPFIRVWDKIRHGVQRGILVGAIWTIGTFRIQRIFVSFFLKRFPRALGLSHDNVFGYGMDVATYTTLVLVSSQVQTMVRFFLGKNLHIARDRAWDQVLVSRGKAKEFWGPYFEEWEKPPQVSLDFRARWEKWITSPVGRLVIRKGTFSIPLPIPQNLAIPKLLASVILLPLNLYPIVGLLITSGIKAVATARYLHGPYFESKKMSPHEVAVFMAERKSDYYSFGFAAALLESIPLVGIFFSISNRIGACMWAFDLEKRQHRFHSGELKRVPAVSSAH